MAKKYENVEKIAKLLDDEGLGGLQKRLFATEKNLSEIVKKLTVLETEKAEREAIAKAEAEKAAAKALAEEKAKKQVAPKQEETKKEEVAEEIFSE